MTRESGSGGSRVTRTECEGGLESSGSDLRFRFVFELTGGSYLCVCVCVYFTSKFHNMARRSCDGTSGPLCGTGRATRWLPAQLSKYIHERAARGRSLPVHSSTRYRIMYIVREPLLGLGDHREKNLV